MPTIGQRTTREGSQLESHEDRGREEDGVTIEIDTFCSFEFPLVL